MPNLVEKTFPDHPQTPDRILSTREEIAHAAAEERVCDPNVGVRRVKARLARIENKRRLRDGQNEKKPVAASPNDQNGQNGENGDDDRPAPHRRDN